jgi:GNAT superfamily N-acetyltransferase
MAMASVDQDVRVEKIPVKDLYGFACEMYERSGPDGVIPIPKHTALAQSHNPYADPDDTSLIVVFVGDRCAGYIAAVPTRLRRGDTFSKLTYISNFYLDAAYRGKGLGKLLVNSVMSLPVDLSGASMSDDARHVYNSTGILGGVGPRTDALLDLRLLRSKPDSILARALGGERGRLAPVVAKLQAGNDRFGYPLLKSLAYRAMRMSLGRERSDVTLEEGHSIPSDALEGGPPPAPAAFHRGVEWINWRLEYPWILNQAETDDRYDNYFFRAVQPFFEMLVVNVHDKASGRHLGFVVMSISVTEADTTIKVLDHHFRDVSDAVCITDVILRYARRHGADRVAMGQDVAEDFRRSPIARRLLVPLVHEYVSRPIAPDSPLALAMDEIELDACDGDFSFT